jgi:hypothetical protein
LYADGVTELDGIGVPTNHDDLLDALEQLWLSNTNATGVVMHPSVYRIYAGLKEAVSLAPVALPTVLQGLPLRQTTGCPVTAMIAGNWADLLYGVRATVQISTAE